MDDWEYSERQCPKCQSEMRTRECNDCGGEGFRDDLYEEDPLWYDEDDTEPCHTCAQKGHETWCGECGWDDTYRQFMSPDYEAAWLAKQAPKAQQQGGESK